MKNIKNRNLKPKVSESNIQKAVINFLKVKYPSVIAIAPRNEGKRTFAQTNYEKAIGMLAGAADLILFMPGGGTLHLELKTERGRLSENQKRMRDRLAALGHDYRLAYGFEDAVRVVESEYRNVS